MDDSTQENKSNNNNSENSNIIIPTSGKTCDQKELKDYFIEKVIFFLDNS